MARRQRDFKAEYAARKAAGRAAGKSTQRARGHRAGEHITRAARRLAQGRLTRTEEAFLDRQLRRAGSRRGVTADERRRIARETFQKMTPAERDSIRAEQRHRARRKGEGNKYGMSPLAILLLAQSSGPGRFKSEAA